MRRLLIGSSFVVILALALYFFVVPKDSNGEVKGASIDSTEMTSDKIETFYGPVGQFNYQNMFSAIGATIYPEDKYQGFPDPSFGRGSAITVYRAMQVDIKDGKKRTTYRTWQKTIGDLLTEKGLELGKQDMVKPALTDSLVRDELVVITRVAETDVDEYSVIKYKTVNKNTPDLERGTNQVQQAGKNGKLKKTYHVRREDGEEVSRKLLSQTVVDQPTDEIILVGTGPKLVHSGPYMNELNGAAKKYNVDATTLSCMMMAESGGTADTGYPDSQYNGLFQYEQGFWNDISAKAGYGGSSIYSGTAQINTTAYALTHGYASRWPTYKRCAK